MDVRFTDPREAIWTAGGTELDAIGSMSDVDSPRDSAEPDHDYRLRLIARLRGEGVTPRA